MRLIRVRPLLLALACLLAPAAAAAPAEAETLADLQRRLAAVSKLLEEYIALATRDEGYDKVETYQSYTEEDFKKRDRAVKAADLAAIVGNVKADKELRLLAVKVLQGASFATQDPDLAVDRRDTKRRRQWARTNLLPMITKDDEDGGDNLGRSQAHEILNAWFKDLISNRGASDVANFDAAKKKTWEPAAKVWRDILK